MNEIIESLFKRKSVRGYTEQEISKETKELLFEAANQASTAGNMTLYSMIDVTDAYKKEKLAEYCDNQPIVVSAKMVVVFLADYSRWYRVFKDIDSNIRELGLGDLELATVEASIAAQNMVVAAESMGIGSCYIGDIIERFEDVRELLNLPANVAPVCMLVLGYPDKQNLDRPKPPRFKQHTFVYENEYKEQSLDEIYESFVERNPLMNDPKAFVKKIKDFKWAENGFSDEMNRSQKVIIDNFLKK